MMSAGLSSAAKLVGHEVSPVNYPSKQVEVDVSLASTEVKLTDAKVKSGCRAALLKIIKPCEKEKNMWNVRKIYADAVEKNIVANDIYVATALITTYAKCGKIKKAQEVFDQIRTPSVVSWNSLISGYAQNGFSDKALECFKKMQITKVDPSLVTYVCVLKACGALRSLETGKAIDAKVRKQGLLKKSAVLGTALVDMYSKCGEMEKAREVFEMLPMHDVVSWSALIGGYSRNGFGDEALKCFRRMQTARVHANAITYVALLKACGSVKSLEIGELIDVEVRKTGIFQKNVVVGTALMDMYSKCGALEKAREIFEQLPVQNVVSWNALMTGYIQNGLGDETLKCFRRMQDTGICPNVVTYISVLKACGIVGSLAIGEKIDSEVRKQGLLQKDVVLGTSLVDMYSKCGVMEKAQQVFEKILVSDVVSWNALIAGYAQNGLGHEALKCFRKMQDVGVYPDVVTYICILKACGILRSLEIGQDIDAEVRRKGLLQKDIVLGNTLIDMYSKCGALEKAREVFEELLVRNVVSWSVLINGYVEHGLGDEALKCFKQMQVVRIYPDTVTFMCVLKACAAVGSLEMGEDIHVQVRKQGLLQKDVLLSTALVDMYSKCGALEQAQEVFDQLPERNVVCWSALVAGYAQVGQTHVVLDIYRRMKSEGIEPNSVTFIVLLAACSHSGLLKEGEVLFNEMCAVYRFTPTLEHYNCMVSLFGRAGQLNKVKALLEKVPHSYHIPLVSTILGVCNKWTDVRLGRCSFEQIMQLDKTCVAAYVSLQNIYTTIEM